MPLLHIPGREDEHVYSAREQGLGQGRYSVSYLRQFSEIHNYC